MLKLKLTQVKYFKGAINKKYVKVNDGNFALYFSCKFHVFIPDGPVKYI